ncbi:MAG: hypothetical protein OXP36_13730 [Gammaproteobacteria bacterium]|nr:hypothetical protein [Gammaproteobacteria bacterium]
MSRRVPTAVLLCLAIASCEPEIVPPDATPANQAPTTVGEIPRQRLPGPGSNLSIQVATHFSDPDGNPLTFTASSSDTAVVRVSMNGSQVDMTGGSIGGQGTVTVAASDPAGLSAVISFVVVVNRPPVASRTISTQGLMIEDPPMEINVAETFNDPDGDPLTHEATSSDLAIVTVRTVGPVVMLEARALGEATVTVMARDPDGQEARIDFNAYTTDHHPYPIHLTYSSEREPFEGFYAAADRAAARWARVLAPTAPVVRGTVTRSGPCVISGHTVPLTHGDTLAPGLNLYVIMPDDTEREGVWATRCLQDIEGQATHGVIGWNPYASWLEQHTAKGRLLEWTEEAILHEIGHTLGVGLSEHWWEHIERHPIEPIMGGSHPTAEWWYHTGPEVIGTLERMTGRPIPAEWPGVPASSGIHWHGCVSGTDGDHAGDVMGLSAGRYSISDLTLSALEGYSFEPAAIELRTLTPAWWLEGIPGERSSCPVKRQHASIWGQTMVADSVSDSWLASNVRVTLSGPVSDTVLSGDVGPGQFIFRKLPPGDYTVKAFANPQDWMGSPPFYFDSTAVSVTLGELEVVEVTFRGQRVAGVAADAALLPPPLAEEMMADEVIRARGTRPGG